MHLYDIICQTFHGIFHVHMEVTLVQRKGLFHDYFATSPEWSEVTNLLWDPISNKANLRDLIAATGQVISNWIQIVNFSARVTVKFDGWPRKTIGHFFYAMSSFVHHFKSIGEFKLDLQSRTAQFGSKWVICYPVWPWNLMDDLGKQ